MKKRILSYMIVLIVALGCTYTYYLIQSPVKEKITIEAGQKSLDISQFLNEGQNQAVLKTQLSSQELSTLGEHDITIEVKGKDYVTKVNIVDTRLPIVETQNLTLIQNSPIEPEMFIKNIIDDTMVSVYFNKKINTHTIGQQKILLYVKDQANNIVQKEVTLTIVEKN